ncbi:DNA-binding response regulator [Chryseotalea sanaruensis]|uniref:DNA-binding response regulator n=1 Tax=Chryseotalea sanaruensis TaxID=2482724 RepID=A0A401UCS3_9BACT|nr:response regulator [Chryseotalea sanaruensis]GCC52670.1 DNA-binding response regulator [Chryseotalea sanaruensis]
MIRCLIVDDEPYARKLLEEFIQNTEELTLIASANNAMEARAILTRQKIDLVFLDIQMPELTGIDFLKSSTRIPLVVFTTAYAEYALQGFEYDAVDYLLKPFDFNRFLKAVNKITERFQIKKPHVASTSANEKDYIFVKDGTRLVKIDLSSLLYIKGSREYVTFVTKTSKTMTLMSMKQLEQELKDDFVRIHNSFIIRLGAVDEITKDEVIINREALPIGATYKKYLLQKL